MAPLIHLDTHVVVWLYQGRLDLLTPRAREILETEDLLFSPVVALELQYLFEIDRLAVGPEVILDALAGDVALRVRDGLLGNLVSAGRTLSWTRDPFDRLIVGHAMHDGVDLLTRDETIRAHYPRAVW